MPQIAAIATVAAAVISAAGTIMSGNAARGAANYQAAQSEQQAGQERAVSQRHSIEQRRQAGLANSRVTAVAAASGAGATDPTVLNIESNNAGIGEYNALSALYTGEEKARGLEMNASATRYEGQQKRQASLFQAGGDMLSGAGKAYTSSNSTLLTQNDSLYKKYGEAELPWLQPGNVRPTWAGGGYY